MLKLFAFNLSTLDFYFLDDFIEEECHCDKLDIKCETAFKLARRRENDANELDTGILEQELVRILCAITVEHLSS